MRILITGGTGLLGKSLIEISDKNYSIVATYIGEYDMTDSEYVKYRRINIIDEESYRHLFAEFMPKIVIHTASVGSPNYAEKNKEITWNINVEGTRKIVNLCEQFGSKLVYISSNGIYDGNNAPYSETDKAEPIHFYGQTKLVGEIIARETKVPCAIIRPILMYGWNHPSERQNVVTRALSDLRNNKEFFIYDDVFVNSLYARHCAQIIWKIIENNKYDVFNVAGAERSSIYDLVRKAVEVFELNQTLLKPVKQGFFADYVKRPIDTSYNTKKMETELKILPLTLKDGLSDMKKRQ